MCDRPAPEPRTSNPESRVPSSASRIPRYACVFLPPVSVSAAPQSGLLLEIAQAFSPRYECHRDDLVSIDVTGLERLMGVRRPASDAGILNPGPRASESRVRESRRPGIAASPSPESRIPDVRVGEALVQALLAKGVRGHVALAGTRVAALVLAHARPGLTVIENGDEAAALATVPIDVLARVGEFVVPPRLGNQKDARRAEAAGVNTFTHWALRTLGELAALPAPEVTARLGRQALVWQAIARGEDVRPLVPSEPEERFEGSLELEWPIEGLEPLSFVLTRLLEPLSTQLERRDRGAAVLHVTLDLVTREVHARHLQLPSPLRDVRTLRTLALLDIESHPPAGAIDRVTVIIEPTPGRVVQHTLFTRAQPTPERLSTLLARLGAVMGQDRIGSPTVVESHRPGAFAMRPFTTEHPSITPQPAAPERRPAVVTAFRRCRPPVPARVAAEDGRPVRVTSDRQGFTGGSVVMASGPWRASGNWWEVDAAAIPPSTGAAPTSRGLSGERPWDRDEWDVMLSDHARYRIFHDRTTRAWFIEGMFD
jgi:protein ImuB